MGTTTSETASETVSEPATEGNPEVHQPNSDSWGPRPLNQAELLLESWREEFASDSRFLPDAVANAFAQVALRVLCLSDDEVRKRFRTPKELRSYFYTAVRNETNRLMRQAAEELEWLRGFYDDDSLAEEATAETSAVGEALASSQTSTSCWDLLVIRHADVQARVQAEAGLVSSLLNILEQLPSDVRDAFTVRYLYGSQALSERQAAELWLQFQGRTSLATANSARDTEFFNLSIRGLRRVKKWMAAKGMNPRSATALLDWARGYIYSERNANSSNKDCSLRNNPDDYRRNG